MTGLAIAITVFVGLVAYLLGRRAGRAEVVAEVVRHEAFGPKSGPDEIQQKLNAIRETAPWN